MSEDNSFHYDIVIKLKFDEQLRNARKRIKELDKQLDALESSGKGSTQRGQREQRKLLAARKEELDLIHQTKREIKALKDADKARSAELQKQASAQKKVADETDKTAKKKKVVDTTKQPPVAPTAAAEKPPVLAASDKTSVKTAQDTAEAAKNIVVPQAEALSASIKEEAKKVATEPTKAVAPVVPSDIPKVQVPTFKPTGDAKVDEGIQKTLDEYKVAAGKVQVALAGGARGLNEVSKASGVSAEKIKVLISEYRDMENAANQAAAANRRLADSGKAPKETTPAPKKDKAIKTQEEIDKETVARAEDTQKRVLAARKTLGPEATVSEVAALAKAKQAEVYSYDEVAKAARAAAEAKKAEAKAAKSEKPVSFSKTQQDNLLEREDFSADPLVQQQPNYYAQKRAIKAKETGAGLEGDIDEQRQINSILSAQEKTRENILADTVEANGQNKKQADAALKLSNIEHARAVDLENINKAYAKGIRGAEALAQASGTSPKRVLELHEATRLEHELAQEVMATRDAQAKYSKEQAAHLERLAKEKKRQVAEDRNLAKEAERKRLLGSPAAVSVKQQGGTPVQVGAAVSAVKQSESASLSNEELDNLRATTALQTELNKLHETELLLKQNINNMDYAKAKAAQADLALAIQRRIDAERVLDARRKGFTTPEAIALEKGMSVKSVIAADPVFRAEAEQAAKKAQQLSDAKKAAMAQRQQALETERMEKAARKAAQAQGFFGEHASRALFTFRRLVGIMAVFTLARQLAGSMGMAAREAITFNAALEDARISLAALVAGTGKVTMGGVELTGIEEYKTGLTVADDIIKKLRMEAVKTTATFEDLIAAFSTAVGPGLSAGLDTDQILRISVDISKTAAALKVPTNQLGEEVRSLINGTITLRNTRLAVIGVTNQGIRQARTEGRLFEYLSERMSAFAAASDDVAKSFSGLKSNIWDVFQSIMALGASDTFDELTESLRVFFSALQDQQALLSGEDSTFGINKVAIQGVRELSDGIGFAIRDMREMMSSGDTLEGFVSVAESIGSSLKGAAFVFNSLLVGIGKGVKLFSVWINLVTDFAKTVGKVGDALLSIVLGEGTWLSSLLRNMLITMASIATLMVLWSNSFGLLFNRASRIHNLLRAIAKVMVLIKTTTIAYAASLLRVGSLMGVLQTGVFLVKKAWMGVMARFAAGGIALAPVYLAIIAIAGAITGITILISRWVPISKKLSEAFSSIKNKVSQGLGLSPVVKGEDAQVAELVAKKMEEIKDATRDANLELNKFREMRGLGDAARNAFQPVLDVIYDTEKGLVELNKRIETSEKRLEGLKTSTDKTLLEATGDTGKAIPLSTPEGVQRIRYALEIDETLARESELIKTLNDLEDKPLIVSVDVIPEDPSDIKLDLSMFDLAEDKIEETRRMLNEGLGEVYIPIDIPSPGDPSDVLIEGGEDAFREDAIKAIKEELNTVASTLSEVQNKFKLSAEEASKLKQGIEEAAAAASEITGVSVSPADILAAAEAEMQHKQALVAAEEAHNNLVASKKDLLDANVARIRTITEQTLTEYSAEKAAIAILTAKADAYEAIKDATIDSNVALEIGKAATIFRLEAARQEVAYAQKQVALAREAQETNTRLTDTLDRGAEATRERIASLEQEAIALEGQAGKAAELLAVHQERAMLEGLLQLSEEERINTLAAQRDILRDNLELMLAMQLGSEAEQEATGEKADREGMDPVSGGMYDYADGAPALGDALADSITGAFKSVERSMTSAMGNWVKTGKFDAKSMGIDMAAQMVQQVTAMLIQQMLSWIINMIFNTSTTMTNSALLTANTAALAELTGVMTIVAAKPVAKGGLIPRHYASGGGVESAMWSRKNVPSSDTIPAWLTPGEWVLTRDEVSRIRSGPIDFSSLLSIVSKIRGNSAGSYGSIIKGFAAGGPVSDSPSYMPAAEAASSSPVVVPGFIANERSMQTLINNGPQALTRFLVKSGVQFRR